MARYSNLEGAGGGAIELVKNPATSKPATDEPKKIAQGNHLRARPDHYHRRNYGNVMRILVPLVVTDAQFEEGLDVSQAALVHVSATAPRKQPVTSNL